MKLTATAKRFSSTYASVFQFGCVFCLNLFDSDAGLVCFRSGMITYTAGAYIIGNLKQFDYGK